ncbi:MAG: hypothetical protein WBY75_18950 [Terracidiphilus sp.]
MGFQVSDWVEHQAYGRGQIINDLGTYWVIHYAESGEKKILKSFAQHHGQPPSPGFVFPKLTTSKSRTSKPKDPAKKTTKAATPKAPKPPVGDPVSVD